MSLFLKNLTASFFRAVVSSRPIFNKANSLFASIAINANKHGKLPIKSIGTGYVRSIFYGNPYENRNRNILRKYKLLTSRGYATKKKPSAKSSNKFCDDLKTETKAKAAGKAEDKSKKAAKTASKSSTKLKLSSKGIKCAVEKEGIQCYIDCAELTAAQKEESKQGSSKSESEVCKKPSEKKAQPVKKSKTEGDVCSQPKREAKPQKASSTKMKKLIPDEDADVKALTGTWVSKKCLKFDFGCQDKMDKTGTQPVKLEDERVVQKSSSKDVCFKKSKAEGAPDQNPLMKCVQQCKKKFDQKNMSTKSGGHDDDACEGKSKRKKKDKCKSKGHKKKKKKKSGSTKKDDHCKPCTSKKGGSKEKCEDKDEEHSEKEGEEAAFKQIQQLSKALNDCKRNLAKFKADADGTAGECQAPPQLDKKLPKPKKQEKDVVGGSKSLLKNVCDSIKASRSAPAVAKSKGAKDVKKSKSADCAVKQKQQKSGKDGDSEKPKKKVSDFCKGKADVKKTKSDVCKSSKKKDDKQAALKQAKKERMKELSCTDGPKKAGKSKDPEPAEYCTEPKKEKAEKKKTRIKSACELEKSAKKAKHKMVCSDDPDRQPKHKKGKNLCLEEFGKGQQKTREGSCAKPKPKKSEDCKKKSKSEICKPSKSKSESVGKKKSQSKSDICKPSKSKSDAHKAVKKKKSQSKTDICKPSKSKSGSQKSVQKKPSKSKSDICKPSKSKSGSHKSVQKKQSKSKSDICKPSKSKSGSHKSVQKKQSKSKTDICKPAKSKSSSGKSREKKKSQSKTDICKPSKSKSDSHKAAEKKKSQSKSDICKPSKSKSAEKKKSESKSSICKASQKKQSKSKSDICSTPKTKPLSKPKSAEKYGTKSSKFKEFCPPETDEPKSSKSLPPDQSPLMQCIALCKKKFKANKPQQGKGVPPRDKKPCTTDKKVFKKLVEYSEETEKRDKPKDDIKTFVPCKTENIKPGIRGSKGEGDKKGKDICTPKKKMPKVATAKPKPSAKKKMKPKQEEKEEDYERVEKSDKCIKLANPCKSKEEESGAICKCPDEEKTEEGSGAICECPDEEKHGEGEECKEEKAPERFGTKTDPCKPEKKKKDE